MMITTSSTAPGGRFSALLYTALLLSCQAEASEFPATNPWLAQSAYPISHHNPAQTDETPVAGPTIGKKLSLDVDNTDWMPPALSTANGLVYIANKRNHTYEYFAADWMTGEKKATWEFPDDSVLWNNWGGITVFLEDGDLLLGGFFAIKRFNNSALK